jgi:thioredoxin type arsenate reductase
MGEFQDPPLFLKLIADDLRWKITQALAISDLRVQELSKTIGQPQNLVSYHLKKLLQAHIIQEHKSISDGREVYYGLDFEAISEQLSTVGTLIHPALSLLEFNHLMIKDLSVLFICTHNSARSQIAEGLLRHQAGGRIQVISAGTDPTVVHPLAIKIMSRRGIDISGQVSKSVETYKDQTFDIVITVCDRAKETCPVFPGNPLRIHWSIPDPSEKAGSDDDPLKQFEAVADQISIRVKYLIRGFLAT